MLIGDILGVKMETTKLFHVYLFVFNLLCNQYRDQRRILCKLRNMSFIQIATFINNKITYIIGMFTKKSIAIFIQYKNRFYYQMKSIR